MSPALRCPSCGAPADDASQACASCDTPLPWHAGETYLAPNDPDATRLRPPARPPSAPPPNSRSSASRVRPLSHSSGWAATTSDIDHGRFEPGAIFDDRYRFIGRLGKGGMGEVYRADDLKLGQPVALKFLPPEVDTDPARLTQLHTEVRMARQVSHPNVCRVYDVGEFEGHTFLSMEYVDGEDLASLIRRVGRFPQDRGIELARQICAGLAAAHDRGVVHRDLKPANIMLDGNGKIRITDFGLAGAAGETLRSGTPAYMAPEQLAGGEVTPRSDIYALGLVLFELFTGRRALDGNNLAEMLAKRETDGITAPSTIVRDLDPAIDRAIMRCVETEPAQRPASALAVAAALPGGDPLAAALAAGETPSPEMVAAAGTTSALNPARALLGLAVALGAMTAWAVLSDRVLVTSLVPMPKPPVLLVERAKQIITALGHAPGADSAYSFAPANFLGYSTRHPELGARERLASGNPPALHFWYRGSPTVMIPTGDRPRVEPDDPPMVVSGMTTVVLDPEGRLVRFAAIPPQLDPPLPQNSSGVGDSASRQRGFGATDWTILFEAAGLDMATFASVEPEWTPAHYADTRLAWKGPMPHVPGQELRIEAGGYRGTPVYFQQIAAWTTPTRMPATIAERTQLRWFAVVLQLALLAVFAAAALIARHNLRNGRGDRRGAFRLAGVILLTALGMWALDSKHVADPNVEMTRFFTGQPLWAAGLLWLLYLALEPYVRRFWPATLVSWSRMMSGQWRDPLLGRDILFGIALGALVNVVGLASQYLTLRLGYPITPAVPDLRLLLGTDVVLARTLNHVFNGVLNALFAVFGMVLLKMIFKRERLAAGIAIGLTMLLSVRGVFDGGAPLINGTAAIVIVTTIVLTVQQLGLVATVMLFLTNFMMSSAAVTLDSSKWFFGNSMLLIAIPAALACYAFYASRGGEPLLGRRLLD